MAVRPTFSNAARIPATHTDESPFPHHKMAGTWATPAHGRDAGGLTKCPRAEKARPNSHARHPPTISPIPPNAAPV